ncbi:alkaline phosphatase [Auraticoccus sp. F435]|uniref:Alkaline phosphatase n=1 Tax=Auraticoccus cholistanensis TaxID=2656650 RepID=A0A6A9UR67_9ACTN|nr:alkaline phosphatase D family protein [Auraticoccus cholistanensis]MVA75396.1 alkaline phosphatase [Auraticoccus cholistanensis]
MTSTPLPRRSFVVGAGAAAAAGLGLSAAPPASARRGRGYPFTLGIASGDPEPTAVVLWTRLAPEPFAEDGGMGGARRVPVRWRVATDEGMRRVVRQGTATARIEHAHSVHVDVCGLQPGREYWYQFSADRELSPVGRTRTAPDPRSSPRQLRIASISCQKYEDGFFTSLPHLVQDDPDLVLHLGDYVYEYAIGAVAAGRGTPVPEVARPAPRTLQQWRARHALYKSDPDLQAAHARLPFVLTWDDHEYANDYAGGWEDEQHGGVPAARAAAYQAYWEHQPLRSSALLARDRVRIYRRLHWGDLAQLDVLDGRQYRDAPPCGWGEAQACEAAYDPSITMLGREQESWLAAGLAASTARWNVLGNNVMVSRLDHDGDLGDLLWHDAWDGFPAARSRLLEQVVGNDLRNTVFLTGDWHSTFVNDIHRDPDTPGSELVATEFVGTSVTTNGDGEVYGPYYGPMIRHNPHIRFFDGDRRGYQRHTVTEDGWRTDLVVVDTVTAPTSAASVLGSYVVEDGRPGAVEA